MQETGRRSRRSDTGRIVGRSRRSRVRRSLRRALSRVGAGVRYGFPPVPVPVPRPRRQGPATAPHSALSRRHGDLKRRLAELARVARDVRRVGLRHGCLLWPGREFLNGPWLNAVQIRTNGEHSRRGQERRNHKPLDESAEEARPSVCHRRILADERRDEADRRRDPPRESTVYSRFFSSAIDLTDGRGMARSARRRVRLH